MPFTSLIRIGVGVRFSSHRASLCRGGAGHSDHDFGLRLAGDDVELGKEGTMLSIAYQILLRPRFSCGQGPDTFALDVAGHLVAVALLLPQVAVGEAVVEHRACRAPDVMNITW